MSWGLLVRQGIYFGDCYVMVGGEGSCVPQGGSRRIEQGNNILTMLGRGCDGQEAVGRAGIAGVCSDVCSLCTPPALRSSGVPMLLW